MSRLMTASRALALGACALAASPALAQLDLNLSLDFELDSPSGTYNILPFINAFGFEDPMHPDNLAEVNSPNGLAFGGDTGSTGFVGSDAFPTLSEMFDEAEGFWSITTYDGVTEEFFEYEFEVSINTESFTEDYFRAFSDVNLMDGDTISDTPTLEWVLEPAAFPSAEYDTAFGSVQGDTFGFDNIDPTDMSWSPSFAPLDEGTHSFFIFLINSGNFDQSLVTIGDLVPLDFDRAGPSGFFAEAATRSTLAVRNLQVIPTPASLALIGLAGVTATRRRR